MPLPISTDHVDNAKRWDFASLHRQPTQLGLRGLDATTAFRQAVIIEVLNPKSAMFFLAFLPQFVNPENGAVALQLMTLGLLFVFMGLVSTVVVALSAGHIGKFLRRNPVIMRWQNKAVGSIYCGLGVRLALQER